jgi:dTDP-glucose 4,6-dehydratase/UDP-glucose 4-epimerase/GDP-4-dehydro-6-deoxy-D-mannose reductase
VISYDLMAPDAFLREFLGPDIERVTFEEGDVTDRARLAEVARQNAVASIISAAAITPRVDRERREPQRIIDVNIGGVVNALEVARDLPDFRRFVQISSSAVFGDVPGATELDEDSPANATSLYGITKLAGERIALRYGDLFGLDVIAVRPSNVYGPMERVTPGYAGATELREMLRIHYAGKPIEVAALDAHYRDWTYAEDVAEGIERAWAAPTPPHRVFILASGEQQSVGDVLAAFQANLPSLRYGVVPADAANYPVDTRGRGPLPSNRRAREELGWTPRTPFAEGMRQYLAWIAAHGPQ